MRITRPKCETIPKPSEMKEKHSNFWPGPFFWGGVAQAFQKDAQKIGQKSNQKLNFPIAPPSQRSLFSDWGGGISMHWGDRCGLWQRPNDQALKKTSCCETGAATQISGPISDYF